MIFCRVSVRIVFHLLPIAALLASAASCSSLGALYDRSIIQPPSAGIQSEFMAMREIAANMGNPG